MRAVTLSPSVKFLPLKGSPKSVEDLGTNFESNLLDDPEFTLAKASLLNIFWELTREDGMTDGSSNHWISYVRELRAIGQERIVVRVDSEMMSRLRTALEDSNDPWGCRGYHTASTELHGRNFGLIVNPTATIEVLSGKAPMCRGNLQITAGKFTIHGEDLPQTFADIDFDDNYAFAAHAADVVDHWVTSSGTNPIRIYEYLKARYNGADLGYVIEKRGSKSDQKLINR